MDDIKILEHNIERLKTCINSIDGREYKYFFNNKYYVYHSNIELLKNKNIKNKNIINSILRKSIKLKKIIYRCKYNYYIKNKSILDDYEYDEKEKDLQKMIKSLTYYKNILEKENSK